MRTNIFVAVWLSLAFLISPPITEARQTSTPLETGYIRLVPDAGTTSPAGVAIFGLRSSNVLINEAGVPSSTTIQSGRIFADVNGPMNTGIAFANPNNQDATISFYFTDASGNNFGAGATTLTANHQMAAFLTESPFGLQSSLTGTFTFTSSLPIAAIALRGFVNERSEFLMTTLSVSPLGTGFGGAAVLIPHFADGAGWSTQVVLLNPGDTLISGSIQFYGQGSKNLNATPTKVVIGGISSSTFNYTIQPRSAVRMQTQTARNATEVGSVRITPAATSNAPSGLAIFSYQNAGVTVSAASVPAMPPSKAFRLYVESSGVFGQIGAIQTWLTISNPATGKITVQLSVNKLDGTPTGWTTSVDLPSGGQIAKFASELFPQLPAGFQGVLRITGPVPVGVIGLRGRYNERGDMLITTTPPYDEASQPLFEIDFPHFVTGAGYSTQLILLSTGSAQSGSLMLFTKDGVALPSSAVAAGSTNTN